MFVFILTAIALYGIMRKYRWMYRLCSFVVQLRLYRYSSSTREFSADMTAPQSAMLCKDFSAKRAAPEPSERRAIMELYSVKFIWESSDKWSSFFERRQAYFVLQFFQNKSLSPSFGKDVRWKAFISVLFFMELSLFISHFWTCLDGLF